ncbi:oligopeptide transporter 1 [Trichomonascus vanleenenianus]|uniref:OPT family oligopeptide transporter n=1 Tax=Trichomonascus vanleenenianus TaxID=2268995 RepID=UPI003ECABA0C
MLERIRSRLSRPTEGEGVIEELPVEPQLSDDTKSTDKDIEVGSPSSISEEEFLDEDVRQLPKIVREIVSLEDDPTIPVLTFRFYVLSILFIIPGAFISTMSSYRTTSAAYSIFFVQIASHWCGKWMAKVLPNKEVKIWRWKFNLNPGPWSIKENVAITLSAASGATSNQGTTPISLAEVYYGDKVHPAIAIFFMWAIVWTGYSFAAIARNFLLYDPEFVWPQALMQTTLFETFRKSDNDSRLASKQMKVFFIALVGMTCWEFLPEYVFPMTSSVAVICWLAPNNYTANFIGSGLGGMGFFNFTLDWSNITSSIMLMPYWTQVVQFAAFVFGAWVLIPAAKWGNLGSFKPGLMSNHLFLENGTLYPAAQLMTPDFQFNETRYNELGPIHLGTQSLWNLFFDYAGYISAFTWAGCFGGPQLLESAKKFYNRYKLKKSDNIHQEYTDRLNKIQSSYDEVPLWWYVVLFFFSFLVLIVLTATNKMFIPWWTYIVGICFGAVVVTPMAWLYAISNFQLAIGTFNELLYGYMINSISGFKHPAGSSTYGAIAGDAWYRAQYMLQDQKIGHYMHIAPKVVFFSQIWGELIGIPVNYGALRWVLNAKMEYLQGKIEDPLHQWTGQSLASYNTMAVQYVLVGPKRLFKLHEYHPLPYAFLVGAGLPFVLYALHRFFPRARFNLWNLTIFFSTLSNFYGNMSTGYLSQFIGGTVTNFWAYRKRHDLWKRYNYLLGAAFDTGFNLAILLIFIFFSAGKQVDMPNWWGNNALSVERCFGLARAES